MLGFDVRGPLRLAARQWRHAATGAETKIDNRVRVGQDIHDQTCKVGGKPLWFAPITASGCRNARPTGCAARERMRNAMDDVRTTLEAADIAAILKVLPQRYPMLMVDRIIDMRGDESAIGIKNVTANEPQFLGHFPGNPVFPGVLIIEGMAQTAGALCCLAQARDKAPKQVYFLTIDKAKFRKPVIPGDTLEYHMTKIARKKRMWWFRGEAKVAGQLVAEAEVGAMFAEASNERN
jgi:3-hydroxyacyl-[acyl-carrier-protein] dehydratase